MMKQPVQREIIFDFLYAGEKTLDEIIDFVKIPRGSARRALSKLGKKIQRVDKGTVRYYSIAEEYLPVDVSKTSAEREGSNSLSDCPAELKHLKILYLRHGVCHHPKKWFVQVVIPHSNTTLIDCGVCSKQMEKFYT